MIKKFGLEIIDINALKISSTFLKKKLRDHGVTIIRNQNIDNRKLVKFSKLLGKPIIHNFSKNISKYPEIMTIIKEKNDKKMFGGTWHSDSTYLEKPPRYTILYPKTLPGKNLGGTKFACMINAYNLLNKKTKKTLEKIYVCNSSKKKLYKYRKPQENNKHKKEIIAYHSIVKKISSEMKALYYSPGHIKSLSVLNSKILKPKKNKTLISEIESVLIDRDNIFTHQWEKGDLVIWDNYRVIHCPINNFKNKKRVMLRISVK